MKSAIKLLKERNYCEAYNVLKKTGYDLTIDNFQKDFSAIESENKFCFLVYQLSVEFTVSNTLLLLDFLMYTDTFFYDIHPVIKFYSTYAIEHFPNDIAILRWILETYEGHPDSPFIQEDINQYKMLLAKRSNCI